MDEALLEEAESAAPLETLRLWESPQPLVVIGRSSRRATEVQVDACGALGHPHPAARSAVGRPSSRVPAA